MKRNTYITYKVTVEFPEEPDENLTADVLDAMMDAAEQHDAVEVAQFGCVDRIDKEDGYF